MTTASQIGANAAVPRVSVVLPAYNVAPFVAESVTSIHAQTWPDIALIAIDDGSRDGTGALLDRLARDWAGPGRSMTVIHQPNAGAAAARNRGLEMVDSPLIALLDADDVYRPNMIARQVELLQSNPELDLSFAMYRYIDAAGQVLGVQHAPANMILGTADILADNIVHAPLFRAEVVADNGGMDPELSAHIDLDFFLRLTARRENAIGAIPEPLSDYRRHATQITGDWRRMQCNYDRILRKRALAGQTLNARDRRRVFGRLRLYWATLAYQADAYADARRLILSSLATDPLALAADPHGRVRLAACLASLLPRPLHDRLRTWFNGRATA